MKRATDSWTRHGRGNEVGEAIYTDDQREWLREIERFMMEHEGRVPTLPEALAIAKDIGYVKIAAPCKPDPRNAPIRAG